MTERYWHDEWEQDKYQLKISSSKQAEISGGAIILILNSAFFILMMWDLSQENISSGFPTNYSGCL